MSHCKNRPGNCSYQFWCPVCRGSEGVCSPLVLAALILCFLMSIRLKIGEGKVVLGPGIARDRQGLSHRKDLGSALRDRER